MKQELKSESKFLKWLLILDGIFILIIILILAIASAKGKALKFPPKTYQVGEVIPCKNWNWKVLKVETELTKEERKQIKVTLEGENKGKKTEFRAPVLSIIDDQKREYEPKSVFYEPIFSIYGAFYEEGVNECGLLVYPGFPPKQCSVNILVAKSSKGLTLHLKDPGHCEVNISLGY